jgi:streptogramin lyase
MKVARFNTDGRLMRVWKVPRDAGRMAADSSGCWISSNGALLHIDPSGRLRRTLRAPFGDVATGAGAVWLAENTKVIRVDERTGQTRSIPTGTLRLGGFQHDLTATSDALYLLQHSYTGASNSRLVRIDLRTGSVTRSALIAGIADAVVAAPRAVWVATATSKVSRYDPLTLRRSLAVGVP